MRRLLLILAVTVISASSAHASPAHVKPAELRGHSLGETAAAFLALEPEAQQQADACRQHPDETACARLLAALDAGQRAEITEAGPRTFTLDGGKLVRVTMQLDALADAATADLTNEFGPQSRKTTIPAQNIEGAKWQNHVLAWDTPEASVALYEDNDPSLQSHRLLLVVESRTQDQDNTISVQQLAATFPE